METNFAQEDFDNDYEKERKMYPKILRWMAKLDLHSWQMGYESALDRMLKIQDVNEVKGEQ